MRWSTGCQGESHVADALDKGLELELETLKAEGRAKPPERVIVGYIPPQARGPRYKLQGREGVHAHELEQLPFALQPSGARPGGG